MNSLPAKKLTPDQSTDLSTGEHRAARQRKCLMCQETFTSSGIGERVCTPCKSTDLWSSGTSEHRVLPR